MSRRSLVSPRLLLGLALILFGLVSILDNLGFEASDLLHRHWPWLLVAIGLVKLLESPGSGLFWILAGTILLLPSYVGRFRYEHVIPAFLVLLGLRLTLRSFGGGRVRERRRRLESDDADTVRALAFLSSVRRQVESQHFQGGDLTALLGACELDLYQAALADDGAVLDILAFWGGVEIKVPQGWQVSLEVVPVMGGAEDKTRSAVADTGSPRLAVRGFVLMGGVEVRH